MNEVKAKSLTLQCAKLGCCITIACAAISAPTEAVAHSSSDAATHSSTRHHAHQIHKRKLDRSGKVRKGRASYYGKGFAGKKMADGTPMNPHTNVAASKTLPLGTKAEVTNLENGKSAVVEIRDRGPYVDGRIIDLSPKTARKLDLIEAGTAPVEVRPIELPPLSEGE